MSRIYWILILFISFISIKVTSQTYQPTWESWTSVELKKDFKKGFSADAQYQIRFDHDISTFKASYLSAGLYYKLNKYVSFLLGYRFATNIYTDQHRFSGGINLKYGVKKWDFELRLVYQNDRANFNKHFLDYHKPDQIIRARFTISKTFKKHYEVYASCEPFLFVSNKVTEITRVRSMVGFKYNFKKYHSIDIAYLFQPDINKNRPLWTNAINIGYQFKLPKWKKMVSKKKKKQSL